jgi:hypothetical protein
MLAKHFCGLTDENHEISEYIPYRDRDLNPEPSKYKSEAQNTRSQFSAVG